MSTIIKSSKILTENGFIDGFLIHENGKIIEITKKMDSQEEIIDYGDKMIIPGLFETHNHGVYGYLLRDTGEDMEKVIEGYLKGAASFGISNVFPTCSYDLISTVRDTMDREVYGSKILGIHVEGPWLNRVGEKGAAVSWPETSLNIAEKMYEDGRGKLALVAASPDIEGIVPILNYFKNKNIKLAFAHSNLKYEEAAKAIREYYDIATHLGNAMEGIHHRDIGSLGACLLDDKLQYEIICDGVHISLDMLKLYFKTNDFSRFIAISDNSGFAGAPVGAYVGWQPSQSYIVGEDGRIRTETGRIAGSNKSLLEGVKTLIDELNVPIQTAIEMASLNPCKFYGFSNKGSLAVNKDADYVVIDDDFNVYETYSEGKKIFDSNIDKDLLNHYYLNTNKK